MMVKKVVQGTHVHRRRQRPAGKTSLFYTAVSGRGCLLSEADRIKRSGALPGAILSRFRFYVNKFCLFHDYIYLYKF